MESPESGEAVQPPCLLSQLTTKGSVLGLACSSTHLFAALVKDIYAWKEDTLQLAAVLRGHDGSVLSLEVAEEKQWLFSSAGDNTIRVWSTTSFECLYLVHSSHDNVGDIFTIVWSQRHHALFLGAQDCSISWFEPPCPSALPHNVQPTAPRYNRFFDSVPYAARGHGSSTVGTPLSRISSRSSSHVAEHHNALPSSPPNSDYLRSKTSTGLAHDGNDVESHEEFLEMSPHAVMSYAHNGYVYAMCICNRGESSVLVSASGDGETKLWEITRAAGGDEELCLSPLKTLTGEEDSAVLSTIACENTIFAGYQGGTVKIWDLDTFQCIRTIRAHTGDILTLSCVGGELVSCAADGTIKKWSRSFSQISEWKGHDGIILASNTKTSLAKGSTMLLTGGSDNCVKLWHIVSSLRDPSPARFDGLQGTMFQLLGQFVAYKSVSRSSNREDCRQAAAFLKRTLRNLGARSSLLPGAEGRNPLVLGIFSANKQSQTKKRKRILYYGHYDVVQADNRSAWEQDPFSMFGKNGFVYGRGTSDNKGPTISLACAASDLWEAQALDVDIVLLIEGEEEQNSAGLREAVQAHRAEIGQIDVILVSNASWLSEDIPAILTGLRGVIHARVVVQSIFSELHSGLAGGVVNEPLLDLTRTLALCVDKSGRIAIPGFYTDVKQLDAQEELLYEQVLHRTKGLTTSSHILDKREALLARFARLRLTLSHLICAYTDGASLPFHVTISMSLASIAQSFLPVQPPTSQVTVRIVPHQELTEIEASLVDHLKKSFNSLGSKNSIEVTVRQDADWWLSDPGSMYNQAMMRIVHQQWKIQPLFIREGGSVPSVPWLEKEFACQAVHVPLSQASSNGHLPNESIRILNLEKGRDVFKRFFEVVADL